MCKTDRFKLISKSGVVIQHPDGSIEAVDPDKAREHLDAMRPAQRALYEKVENPLDLLSDVVSEK